MSAPLTVLSEEEQLLYDSVLEYANENIKPIRMEMDEKQQMDPKLIKDFF